jgi:hypothetical protein
VKPLDDRAEDVLVRAITATVSRQLENGDVRDTVVHLAPGKSYRPTTHIEALPPASDIAEVDCESSSTPTRNSRCASDASRTRNLSQEDVQNKKKELRRESIQD